MSATTGAVATALGLKSLTKVKSPSHSTGSPLILYPPPSLSFFHPDIQAPPNSPQSSSSPGGPQSH